MSCRPMILKEEECRPGEYFVVTSGGVSQTVLPTHHV